MIFDDMNSVLIKAFIDC